MHAQRVDARVEHALMPSVILGRLALTLQRQIDSGLDRRRTLGQNLGPAILAGGGAGGQDHMGDAVQFDRGLCNLGQLLGRLVRNGATGGKALPDRAELTGLFAALITDALNQSDSYRVTY